MDELISSCSMCSFSNDDDVNLECVLVMNSYRPLIDVVFNESFYTKTNTKNNRLVRQSQNLLE